MGAGASALPDKLNEDEFKAICGEDYDQSLFAALKDQDEMIEKEIVLNIILKKEEVKEAKLWFTEKVDLGNDHITVKDLESIFLEQDFIAESNELNDPDGTRKITLLEFLKIMLPKLLTSTEIVDSFQVFDVNKDGFITAEELENTMVQMGETMTAEDAEEMILEADINKDGKIDLQEYNKKLT